jgi:multiple sugar transport system ATP-binding protein
MRAELKLLFERIQGTVLYVTHDQAEAMTLSDRVVVMNHGLVQQVGTPLEVYNRPNNEFVAGFLGSPSMNFVACQLQQEQEVLMVRSEALNWSIPLSASSHPAPARLLANRERLQGSVTLGIRPEDIALEPATQPNGGDKTIPCHIAVIEPMGAMNVIVVYIGRQQITLTTDPDLAVKPGEQAQLRFNPAKVHFFDPENGQNLTL